MNECSYNLYIIDCTASITRLVYLTASGTTGRPWYIYIIECSVFSIVITSSTEGMPPKKPPTGGGGRRVIHGKVSGLSVGVVVVLPSSGSLV